jgi:ribonucleoside-diphosphate reductase alpha chain
MTEYPERVYRDYIHLSKYARWLDKEKRRENWDETVKRYIDFWLERYPEFEEELEEAYIAIIKREVMPSMRALMTAGKALSRCNTVGYNCAGIAIDHPRAFDEIFYLLMGGSGVGFSVSQRYIDKLPIVAEEFHETDTTIVVQDSRTGWAKALKELISLLYSGDIPKFDVSNVRPAGARLKTMGGRASGPDPLMALFNYAIRRFREASGRRLNSIECHDLACMIAHTVIVGNVRRAACISFSDLSDERMRVAKSGQWYEDPMTEIRRLSNNSAMYYEKPSVGAYLKEMKSVYISKSGERAIVNQLALQQKAEECGREHDGYYLLNPCGEAILRDTGGMCNLSEIVAREDDSLEELARKAKIASFLGTLQSTLTDFKYIRKQWQRNAEEERLLGVSITGVMDHRVLAGGKDVEVWLSFLKGVVVGANHRYAGEIGIPTSKQHCLIKPSGTVSSLVGSSPGMHPREAGYYIRRATQDVKDPLTKLMIDQKIPHVIDKDKVIFSFPIASPKSSICRSGIDPLEQLRVWKIYRDVWCDGNPSQTIYYNDENYMAIMNWVWENWESVGGLSFFPSDDNVYENQPYEEVTLKEYKELVKEFPEVDFEKLGDYEKDNSAVSMNREIACSGGTCEI